MSYDNLFWGGKTNGAAVVDNHTQWRIKVEKLLPEVNIFTPHTRKAFPLGAIAEARDGRLFRYCENGTAAELAKALVNSSAALDAQAITSTVQTAYGAAAGEKKFDVLLTTGNAWVADDLIDGWLLVSDGGAAMSDMYMIKGNKFTIDDTVMNVEISDTGGLRTAIAATDDVILFQNKCANTVVSATDPVSAMVGVSLAIVPISTASVKYYYWAQFKGPAPILVDGTDTVVVGDTVTLSDSVDGTIHLNDAGADDVIVGTCVFAGAVNEPCIIDMLIP